MRIFSKKLQTQQKLVHSAPKVTDLNQNQELHHRKVWIQKILRLQEGKNLLKKIKSIIKSYAFLFFKILRLDKVGRTLKKYGRSLKEISPTIFMILVSLIPYIDFFLNFFIDTDEIVVGHRFKNLSALMWSYSVCISPLLILYVSKLKPHWMSYIVPIYVYVSMFLGFFLLDINLNIESDYVFRLVALGLSLVLLILSRYLHRYFKVLILDDKVEYEIMNLQKQNNDKGTATDL